MGGGKKAKPNRVPVPLSDLELHFQDQLHFLRKSIRDFDDGDRAEFRRMAVALRVLLHERPPTSHALIKQVGIGEASFESYARPLDDKNLISEFSLALVQMSEAGVALLPMLDHGLGGPRQLSLTDWWNEPVLRDMHRRKFTRGEIIRAVANQDGGAHVDPHIDEAYHHLAKEHSIGVVGGPRAERSHLSTLKKCICGIWLGKR